MGRGAYRTPDGLYSKWGFMNADLTKFMGMLNKHTNNRHSGWSDKDIFTHSLAEFKAVVGRDYKFPHLVDIAKLHPKWANTPSFSPSAPKRSKTSETTSSDTREPVELDDDDDIQEFEEPRRPEHGKKKATMLGKQARRASSTISTQSNKSEQVKMLNQTMEQISNLRAEQNDFKILEKSLEGISGLKLKAMKALQKRALKCSMKYIPENDEEDDDDDDLGI